MFNPVSTYRIQFHKDFTFVHLERIIPYLRDLGIKTLYASPIFEATPGSTHGYDGLNPHRINPEIGTEEDLRRVSKSLKEAGIAWLQDIVPNHMAFDPRNPWLMDVLEKGRQSQYAGFFDIAWNSALYEGKLMVPFLGSTLEEVIQKGELKLTWHNGYLALQYYDSIYPVNLRTYERVLSCNDQQSNDAVRQLLPQIHDLHTQEEAVAYSAGVHELKLQLGALMKNETVRHYVQGCMNVVNQHGDQLAQVATEQYYRLCHWQETDRQINFRRFFTVNGLICLNIQDQQVFDHFHQYIKKLMDEGIFQGLRVDHIDGLYAPGEYLERLKALCGGDPYVVVEKILEPGESLPTNWAVKGNTGYDFLSMVNNLLTYRESEEAFTQYYYGLAEEQQSVHQQIRNKKAFILYHHMGGELENLYQLLMQLNLVQEEQLGSLTGEQTRHAIGALLVHIPVYRFYGSALPLQADEALAVENIFSRIRQSEPELAAAVDLLEWVLLRKPLEGDEEYNVRAAQFYQRCMQFSGPLMAKGVEDTLMYTFNRFIGHNEVGDAPEPFGCTVADFHEMMKARQEQWPLSINTTSTHDTKRGEDVRARLNVLTDLGEEWLQKVDEWRKLTKGLKKGAAPDINDEYFIYQVICGTFPMPGEDEDSFQERINEYLQKALREAKRHSNWTAPNEEYENAAKDFAQKLLDKNGAFWKSFSEWQQKIVDAGILNSLVQLTLKFTCPGVPDVYQGTELWDLSFVDPDNRRPADYQKRSKWLNSLTTGPAPGWPQLWNDRYSGKIKLWLTHKLQQLRQSFTRIFSEGEYMPLEVKGQYGSNVLAFIRKHRNKSCLVAVPLHMAGQTSMDNILSFDWKDTRIVLPPEASGEWTSAFTSGTETAEGSLAVQDIFAQFPLAFFTHEAPPSDRGAGILLHITSLPSPFGVGDMGPEAKAFADFLYRGHQRYWQLLPLNPTEGGQGHSPYSAISSKAGNTLLISPELLAAEGLLDDLHPYYQPQEGKTDYENAEKIKKEMFGKAWERFSSANDHPLQTEFVAFCEREKEWLDDFALYLVLKQQNGGKPWYEWPEEFKQRNPSSLANLAKEVEDELQKVKWLQYIFARQWKDLKAYANGLGIEFMGDLPFYVSYDSADVWAQRDIFAIDENGDREGLAGVPPDAFSDDGQLWGMPVFRWDLLKEQNYDWWIGRFQKNMELFDLVRLDHFRAFSAYWEVPAGEQTAKNGVWKEGPGADFFTVVKEQLGELPFVAEDLGEIDAPVYALRDAFHLPGMKVLQFAFGEDMPGSPHVPHGHQQNFLVYTGTHDNNTIRGWSRQEGAKDHHRLSRYVGRPLEEDEIPGVMCRMAYASVARIAILPLQDVLGLDEIARMNTPASGESNWQWRLLPGQVTHEAEHLLKEWTQTYGRGG
jgi:malto-oligosyltrehalose synthase/4-alpha-glucanotransferase